MTTHRAGCHLKGAVGQGLRAAVAQLHASDKLKLKSRGLLCLVLCFYSGVSAPRPLQKLLVENLSREICTENVCVCQVFQFLSRNWPSKITVGLKLPR